MRKNKYNRTFRSTTNFWIPGFIVGLLLGMLMIGIASSFTLYTADQDVRTVLVYILLGLLVSTPLVFALSPLIFGRRFAPAKRVAEVLSYIQARGLSDTYAYADPSPIFSGLHYDSPVSTIVTASGNGWRYSDFDVAVTERDGRGGSFVKYHSYYSVLEIPLPRRLPNVFFDSLKGEGLSMLYALDDNQRLSLEGDFDSYFATYSPKGYEIDTLAFITPEVMHELIAAHQYDIEIYGKTLYLYSDIVPTNKIDDMVARGVAVYKTLMNNIVTYSDSRLTQSESRVTVAIEGNELSANKRLQVFATTVIVGVAMVPSAFMGIIYLSKSSIHIVYLVLGLVLLIVPTGAGFYALRMINAMLESKPRRR